MKAISFKEALIKTSSKTRNLLLGNGFSRGYSVVFNYTNLFSKLKTFHGKEMASVINTFDYLRTPNFEEVTSSLETTAKHLKVLAAYTNTKENLQLSHKMASDAQLLKRILIQIISQMHPEYIENKLKSTLSFFSHFAPFNKEHPFQGKIFTLNYDLILYWALMQDKKQEYFTKRQVFFCDGFNNEGTWEEKDESYFRHNQNIYYLHGALFLAPLNSHTTKKLSTSKHPSKEKLFKQIEEGINSGHFPLFVTEGSAEQKISEIRKNGYLNHAYHSLSQIQGSLFIFGSSFSEFDNHIWKKLNDNQKIEKIFVGLHQSSIKETEHAAKKALSSHLSRIEFFDTGSACLWGEVPEMEVDFAL